MKTKRTTYVFDMWNTKHLRGFLVTGGSKAATIASSKTFFKPFCVKAEHSTYLTAPISLASLSPCSAVTGLIFCLDNFSTTEGSSRKSICVPTIKHGTPGQ
ncbi:unnamed protein product [Rhizophagus irregularis]|nr:unnamed protein product [Rhizophagus irregularis]